LYLYEDADNDREADRDTNRITDRNTGRDTEPGLGRSGRGCRNSVLVAAVGYQARRRNTLGSARLP
jgi:hypothetical protein